MPVSKNYLCLISTLLAGFLIFLPQLDYKDYLSQGDHGRDLYTAQATLQGQLPYKDYFWNYGPLMPFYYALVFKILGVSVQSMLLGEIILKILCGVFIYLSVEFMTAPLWAFLAAL